MKCCSQWTKITGLAVIFACGGLFALNFVPQSAHSQTTPLPGALPETEGTHAADALSAAFRQVIQEARPAVVAVRTETDRDESEVQVQSGIPEEFLRQMPPQLRRQFEFRMPQEPDPQSPEDRDIPLKGVGSGFIVSGGGIVITNNHVIENADRVYITLDDGRELPATRWETDPVTDVAVVFVETDTTLPTVRLGNSARVEPGDWVLAFGNPFDIGTTVTQGIISAKQRQARLNIRENYLQSDAAVNPGNSGGPLVNLRGEVIGMNTAISSRSGGYDGVSFAIPSNTVRRIAEQLIESGRVRRAFLGVRMRDMTREDRAERNLRSNEGVLIEAVNRNTPASKAGLQAEDVILEFAGTPINTPAALANKIETLQPGQSYPALLRRDGEAIELSVTLEEMPENFFAQATQRPDAQPESILGIEVGELTADIAEQLGLEQETGVVITDVAPDSPAAAAGVQVGDVVVRVGRNNIGTLDAFRAAVGALSQSQSILMTVSRDGRERMLIIKLTDE